MENIDTLLKQMKEKDKEKPIKESKSKLTDKQKFIRSLMGRRR